MSSDITTIDVKTSSGQVPAKVVVLWVFAFIVWGVIRQKLVEGPIGDFGLDLMNRISVLEFVQVYLIAQLARAVPQTVSVSWRVALATLLAIAGLVLLLRYRPSYASGGLEIGLLALSAWYPPLRTVAVAVTLFVFQYVFLSGPFLWLHELVGQLDAAVLRSALVELGYPAFGYGPFVVIQGSSHGINVMGACSSSNVLATVGSGYLILVLGLRKQFAASDILWGTALISFTVFLNWMRLMPMAISLEGHAFWHDGFGASLVSLAYAALVGMGGLPRHIEAAAGIARMMERLFHAACAVILALSFAAFVHGDQRERLTDDPRRDLLNYLALHGAKVGSAQELPGRELIVALTLPGCAAEGKLVYLPVIHRISEVARQQWLGVRNVVFVHDRQEVGTLAAWRIIPTWLVRRLGVNFQLYPEDPWISIAFVLVPPEGCRWPQFDWSGVSAAG